MKKVILTSLMVINTLFALAQDYNPYVNQGIVSPAPLLPAEFNGTGVVSFNVGNTGSTPLALVVNQEMTLVVTLSYGVPNAVNPLDALGGTWKDRFNWTYDAGIKTYYGKQNQTIPGSSLGTITVQYKVTDNSNSSILSNGFNCNLQPPPYTNGVNTTDDDQVSSYTYVKAVDYGDAPLAYGAAGHEINVFKDGDGLYINYIYLGASVDPESAYQDTSSAQGDDLNLTDDEDGVTFPALTTGSSIQIPVVVTVNDFGSGALNAWIDWNGDGDFADAGEKIYGPVTLYESQTVLIPVTIPTTAISTAPTFARFRFGNNTGSSGLAATSWGEVEDYQISIQKPTLLASATKVDVQCFGGMDGSINLSVTEGFIPYTYAWTGPNGFTSNQEDLTGLAAGSYTVLVSDRDLNTTSLTVVISQPALLVLQTTVSQPLCFGQRGSVLLNTIGGTAPYTYVAGNPSTTNLTPGTYTYQVTDAHGCLATAQVSIVQPAQLVVSISSQTNVCFGSNTGSATAGATGGTPGYTYLWNTIPTQTTQTAIGLVAGTYSVTVTDANNCSASTNVTITQSANPLAAVISNQVNVNCNGNSTGSATVAASGGTPGYTYSWNTTPVQTGATANNLMAGTYSVTVTDSFGCTASASVVITEPSALTATIAGQTDVICYGANTGSATVAALGGTPGYTYVWNTLPAQNTATATGLAAGTYTVTVTDSKLCSTVVSVNIAQPALPFTAQISSQTNLLCYGASNGSASVTTLNGTAGYTYLWNTVPAQITQTATGLMAGTYTVTVTDANNCSATTQVTITQPQELIATISAQPNVCSGDNSGSATVTATGGIGSYTYSWNTVPIQTTATAIGLAAGTYTVTVKDSNNCSTSTEVIILEPAAKLEAVITSLNHIECTDQLSSIGSVQVEATAGTGTAPYSYSLDGINFVSSGTFTPLDAGTYTVTVMDANGCTVYIPFTITQDFCPTALDDIFLTLEDTSVSGNVRPNDTLSADGGNVWSLLGVNGGAANGSVTMLGNGLFTYTPNPNFTGLDLFTYNLCDADGDCDQASVLIYVIPVNDPPIANNDVATTQNDTPVTINVLTNDTDVEGLNVNSVVITNAPDNGQALVNPVNGQVTYTPNNGFTGVDTFEYQVCDKDSPALCDTAIVYVIVNGTENAVCLEDVSEPMAPNTITDSCSETVVPVLVSTTSTPDPLTCEGTLMWTYTYELCDDVVLTWNYTYTIDMQPVILPENEFVTVSCVAEITTPTAPENITDSCGNVLEPTLHVSKVPICEGTVIYTYTYEDCTGTEYNWVYTYTIDYTAGLTIPDNQSSMVLDISLAVDPGAPASITDACGNLINPVLVGRTTSPNPFICDGLVLWTYRYTACDGTYADWTYTYQVYGTPEDPNGQTYQTFCASAGATLADLEVTADGGPLGPNTLHYYASLTAYNNGIELPASTLLTDGMTVVISQKTPSGCESIDLLTVVVALTPVPEAPIAPATQLFCSADNKAIRDLEVNAALGYVVTWYDAQVGGNILTPNTLLTNGNYYVSQTSPNGCESSDRTAVAVTVTVTPFAPTGDVVQTFCASDMPLVADLVAEPSESGNVISWYDASGNLLSDATALVDGGYYFATQTTYAAPYCESTSLLEVKVVLSNVATPMGLSPQTFCVAEASTLADLVVSVEANQEVIWYDAATGGNVLTVGSLLTGTTYYAAAKDENGCISTTRLAVEVVLDVDCDGDGVLDSVELQDQTNPFDGCSFELTHQTLVPDTEWQTTDCDGDGVVNATELIDDTNPLDPCEFELAHQTLNPSDAWFALDCDGDGVTNDDELGDQTDPLDYCDFEVNSQTVQTSSAWQLADCDNDGVLNHQEVEGDTDDDGISDVFDTDDDGDGNDTIDEDSNNDDNWFNDDCNDNGVVDYLDAQACDFIPNAFSPNGDGFNDTWVIPALAEVPYFMLEIYDRWGNIVYDYKNNGRNQPIWWDGISNGRWNYQEGKVLPTGTYFYIIDFNNSSIQVVKTGWLYLQNNEN